MSFYFHAKSTSSFKFLYEEIFENRIFLFFSGWQICLCHYLQFGKNRQISRIILPFPIFMYDLFPCSILLSFVMAKIPRALTKFAHKKIYMTTINVVVKFKCEINNHSRYFFLIKR